MIRLSSPARPLRAIIVGLACLGLLSFSIAAWQQYGPTPERELRAFLFALRQRDSDILYDLCFDPAVTTDVEKRALPDRTRFARLLSQTVFTVLHAEDEFTCQRVFGGKSWREPLDLHVYLVTIYRSGHKKFAFRVGVIPSRAGLFFRRWQVVARPTLERVYASGRKSIPRSVEFRKLWIDAGGVYTRPLDNNWVL
jgi:hypothetical protein